MYDRRGGLEAASQTVEQGEDASPEA